MPGNSFIKFNDVPKGESMQDSHKGSSGWIEIGDWNWEISSDTSFLKGGGASVGKPTPGSLSFTHFYDLSSPTIMKKIVEGRSFSEVHIHMLKQVGESAPVVYFSLLATDAFITKVATKGGEDGAVNQDVEMVFKKVALGYKMQNNDGTLAKSPAPFGWDIAAMKTAEQEVKWEG